MKFPKDSEFICIDHFDEAQYLEALNWVDDHRRVAIVTDCERIGTDPRVKIYQFETTLQIDLIIKQIAWSAVQKKTAIFAEPEFKKKLHECHLAANLILSEMADWGVNVLQNARANHQPSRKGVELKGAFSNIPAIIVGAGPSLEKNKHLLKEFEDKALIFAGGTALNVIDVEPHFAASIDPAAPHEQFKSQPFMNAPFCYQGRMNHENFSLIQGEKIRFPDGSSDAINWIYGEETFNSGWTVGNFLTAIAMHMGCSPIIFVGMDLCYHNMKKYAQVEAQIPDNLVQIGDVWTQNDWLMAVRWTSEQSVGRKFINATEGGILGLTEMPLERVLQTCVTKWDLRKKVIEEIQKCPLECGEDRWAQWDQSIKRLKKGVEDLEAEVVYQKLLMPLWQVWRHIFEREVQLDPKQKIDLHRALFFQQVLHAHG